MNAKPGDLLLLMAGDTDKIRKQMNELRLHMGDELGLRNPEEFKPVWIMDFPLLEWEDLEIRHSEAHRTKAPMREMTGEQARISAGNTIADRRAWCRNKV